VKSETLNDLYAILTAGGRNSGEVSRALPQHAYGDPAKHFEYPAERERQKKLKNVKKLKKGRR
jgi:hypothetical protein